MRSEHELMLYRRRFGGESHGRMGYFLRAISFRSHQLFSSERHLSRVSEVPRLLCEAVLLESAGWRISTDQYKINVINISK